MHYLGINIGGTKTLIARFDEDGNNLAQSKFPTDPDYATFLQHIAAAIDEVKAGAVQSAGVAVPGLVDRAEGRILALGNLSWQHEAIAADISKLIGNAPVKIENDANLAGLAEASFVPEYERVLYVTISTGIGGGAIFDGRILPELQDSEIGQMLFDYQGKPTRWEDFASGRAIVERYGKYASEITDEQTWVSIATDLGWGISAVSAILQLEAIIFGGGVGVSFEKFKQPLAAFLEANLWVTIKRPVLLPAQNSEGAVLTGSYHLARS